jgi:small nuclear ribonucleoprotein (snRNP)-like protein
MTFAINTCSGVRFFSFCLICLVSIVFLGEFVENDGVLAQEKQTLKCPELSNPNSSEELKELRDCLQKVKVEIQSGRRMQKIQRSYDGSLELVKQLNLVMDNETSKQITEDSLNNNSADQKKY